MILERLRAETAEAHRQLEDEVQMAEVAANRDRYTKLLAKFYGYHRPMEARLAEIPAWREHLPAASARRKSPWLAEDLQTLGLSPAEVAALPDSTVLPSVLTAGQAFGCSYVLEGSTLGGRHIATLFAHGPGAQFPRRFFEGYGAETRTRWVEFCQALETAARATPAAEEEIVAAANQTFATFQQWLKL